MKRMPTFLLAAALMGTVSGGMAVKDADAAVIKGMNSTKIVIKQGNLKGSDLAEQLKKLGISIDGRKDYINIVLPENCLPNNGNGSNNGNQNKPEDDNQGESRPEPEKPDHSQTEADYAAAVVKLVNKERAKMGLSPLTADVNVASAANVRAKEIVSSFSHTRPDGRSFSTALKEAGASFRGAGENIAWGQKSPEAVMNAWMNSSGHRANILNASYTSIGVGCYKGSNGQLYWTQLFTN